MDNFAAYRNSRDHLYRSIDDRNERVRRAPLDDSILKARQQQFDLGQMQIDDNAAMRQVGTQAVEQGLSQKDTRKAFSEEMMKQGDIAGAVQVNPPEDAVKKFTYASKLMRMVGSEKAKEILLAEGEDPKAVANLDNMKVDPQGRTVIDMGPQGKIISIDDGAGNLKFFQMAGRQSTGGVSAPSLGTTSKVQELAVGKDPKGADMFQKFQLNPRTGTYDIPLGEPYAKGSFASQVVSLTPESVEDYAITGIVDPAKGKVTGGRVSAQQNQEIANERARIRRELNMDKGDLITRPAEFQAQTKNLVNLQKRSSLANTFVRNFDKQMDQFSNLIEKVRYDNPAILNQPWQAFETYVTGNGKLAAYRALITDMSNEAAKLSMGAEASVAALTEGAADTWSSIHYPAMPTKEMVGLLEETQKIAHQRTASYEDEIRDVKQNIRGMIEKVEGTPKKKNAALAVGDMYQGKKVLRTGRDGDRIFVQLEGVDKPVEVK